MERCSNNAKQGSFASAGRGRTRAAHIEALPLHPLLQLQRAVGNQAMLAMLRSGALQAKLAVGSADAPEEKEADQVAERVMRKRSGAGAIGACTCAAGGEMCEECRKKELDAPGAAPVVRRRAEAGDGGSFDAPPLVQQTLGGAGRPLDAATRADMEGRFGRDFSAVRIHTDGQAAESARSINALAYTVDDHIAFGEGQYAPQSDNGGRLLAHELAHVVQQKEQHPAAAMISRETSASPPPAKSEGKTTPIGSKEDFRQQVFSRASKRLDLNREQLNQWRLFIDGRFSDMELKAQIAATESQALVGGAHQLRRDQFLEPYFAARSPATRAVYQGILNGHINGGCQQCHESNIAWQWNVRHPEFQKGPSTAEELASLANYAALTKGSAAAGPPTRSPSTPTPPSAATSQGEPVVRPTAVVAPPARLTYPQPHSKLCGDPPPEPSNTAPLIPQGPQTALALAAIESIQPVLEPLGPQGYRVLPAGVFSDLYNKTPAQLRTLVMERIDDRQAKYLSLKGLIAADAVDYTELCPIVEETLPLATRDVQFSVLYEISMQKLDRAILDALLFLVGAALLLLSVLAPPTALLVPALLLGAAQLGLGLSDLSRGFIYNLGLGAGVFSPEQEAAAPGLTVGGALNVGFGLLGVVQSGVSLSRLPKTSVGPSGRFHPLADGSYVAFHPQNPNVVVVLEGEQLTAGVWVEGEFRPLATAPSPWPAGSPPPGTPTWAEWTAARGWGTGAPQQPSASGVPALPVSAGRPPLPYGLGPSPQPYGVLGPRPQPFGLLPAISPDTVVWVNTEAGSLRIHPPDSFYFNNTQSGVAMPFWQAERFGYRWPGVVDPNAAFMRQSASARPLQGIGPIEPNEYFTLAMHTDVSGEISLELVDAAGRPVQIDPATGSPPTTVGRPLGYTRNVITGPLADVGEAQALRLMSQRGESVLLGATGSNVPGPDFVSLEFATYSPATMEGAQPTIYVNDVKSLFSESGQFPEFNPSIKPEWNQAIDQAIEKLPEPLKTRLKNAPRIKRQINMDYRRQVVIPGAPPANYNVGAQTPKSTSITVRGGGSYQIITGGQSSGVFQPPP